MFLILACAAVQVPVAAPEPVRFPVDPAFPGDVAFQGANVEYYAVAGRDDAEVLLALRTSPRFRSSGHAAAAEWAVRWEHPDGGACAPADIEVFAEIVAHFPRWDAPSTAPAASRGNWQRYVRALAIHEQGHRGGRLRADRRWRRARGPATPLRRRRKPRRPTPRPAPRRAARRRRATPSVVAPPQPGRVTPHP